MADLLAQKPLDMIRSESEEAGEHCLKRALGPLDLDVHYTPNPSQVAQLRDPPAARGQMLAVMTALLAQHPELRTAFHGMWVHADQGNTTVFALELPMDRITGAQQPPASSKPVSR